jgi:LysR family hydrogen peroxide-inducible transcriptional activator
MNLDPRHLRILLNVVRLGSFSAAARALNMSQPAVSMLIAQLERAVGTQLVERGRQGAVPTQAGRILTRRAEMVETVLDQARREVELGMVEVEGPLVVGGTPGALMSLLPGAVSLLEEEGVRYALRIVEASDAELVQMLRELRVDLAVGTAGVGAVPEDIVERAILTDRFVLVLRAGNGFVGDSATLADVGALEWVLPDVGGAFQRQIEAMFISAGVQIPQRAIRCDSLATMKEIIRRSNHVSILPYRVVAAEVASGQLRQVTLQGGPPPRLVGVRMLRDRTQMPLADRLVRAMADDAARNG